MVIFKNGILGVMRIENGIQKRKHPSIVNLSAQIGVISSGMACLMHFVSRSDTSEWSRSVGACQDGKSFGILF